MLPADVALDVADDHEIVPSTHGKTGDVHSIEMAGAIFLFPPFVVVGMLEHSLEPAVSVVGISARADKPRPSLGSSAASDTVGFMKQAQAGVAHILSHQVRGLIYSQEVLRVSSLGAAERADFPRAPGLLGQPLHAVVTILK